MQSVVVALEAASRFEENSPRGSDLVLCKVRTQSAFFRAMSSWRLTERQTTALVFQKQEYRAKSGVALFVFDEQLRSSEVQIFDRISEVLEVFLLSRQVFASDAAGALWLKSPSKETCFCNLTPLTWMIHGGGAGIKQVRDSLEEMSPTVTQRDYCERT